MAKAIFWHKCHCWHFGIQVLALNCVHKKWFNGLYVGICAVIMVIFCSLHWYILVLFFALFVQFPSIFFNRTLNQYQRCALILTNILKRSDYFLTLTLCSYVSTSNTYIYENIFKTMFSSFIIVPPKEMQLSISIGTF